MKPLKTCQWMLALAFIIPPDKPISERKKRICIAAIFLGIFCLIAYCLASAIFFVNNISVDLETALYALAQIFAITPSLNISVTAFFLRHKILEIFNRLSEIYEKYEAKDLFGNLAKTNKKSEWAWKIFIICAILVLVSILLVIVFSGLIPYMIHGQFDTKHFFHLVKLTLPWNEENRIGYIAENCLFLISLSVYLVTNGTVLMLFISLTWILQAFSKMYRHTANKLKHPDENRNDEKTLCKLVDLQNMAREFFMQLMPVVNPLIVIPLFSNMLLLATADFRLYFLVHYKNFNLEIYVFGLTWVLAFATLLLYCYIGTMASESVANMAACLYDIDWHKFPIKMQKYFVLMIQNAQRPLYFRGSGMITLNLETFCELVRYSYSYFMIFITLTTK